MTVPTPPVLKYCSISVVDDLHGSDAVLHVAAIQIATLALMDLHCAAQGGVVVSQAYDVVKLKAGQSTRTGCGWCA